MGVPCRGSGRVRGGSGLLPCGPLVPNSRALVRTSPKLSLAAPVLAGPLLAPEAAPGTPHLLALVQLWSPSCSVQQCAMPGTGHD